MHDTESKPTMKSVESYLLYLQPAPSIECYNDRATEMVRNLAETKKVGGCVPRQNSNDLLYVPVRVNTILSSNQHGIVEETIDKTETCVQCGV